MQCITKCHLIDSWLSIHSQVEQKKTEHSSRISFENLIQAWAVDGGDAVQGERRADKNRSWLIDLWCILGTLNLWEHFVMKHGIFKGFLCQVTSDWTIWRYSLSAKFLIKLIGTHSPVLVHESDMGATQIAEMGMMDGILYVCRYWDQIQHLGSPKDNCKLPVESRICFQSWRGLFLLLSTLPLPWRCLSPTRRSYGGERWAYSPALLRLAEMLSLLKQHLLSVHRWLLQDLNGECSWIWDWKHNLSKTLAQEKFQTQLKWLFQITGIFFDHQSLRLLTHY